MFGYDISSSSASDECEELTSNLFPEKDHVIASASSPEKAVGHIADVTVDKGDVESTFRLTTDLPAPKHVYSLPAHIQRHLDSSDVIVPRICDRDLLNYTYLEKQVRQIKNKCTEFSPHNSRIELLRYVSEHGLCNTHCGSTSGSGFNMTSVTEVEDGGVTVSTCDEGQSISQVSRESTTMNTSNLNQRKNDPRLGGFAEIAKLLIAVDQAINKEQEYAKTSMLGVNARDVPTEINAPPTVESVVLAAQKAAALIDSRPSVNYGSLMASSMYSTDNAVQGMKRIGPTGGQPPPEAGIKRAQIPSPR